MKHKIGRIHFVGIGGSGMSGIAEVFLNLGYSISGSDLQKSAVTDRLEQLGATIHTGHSADNVKGADTVVLSTAINASNPEVMAARALQIPIVSRATMLAELMRFKQGIAISGTHGKTTTTSLIASVLAAGDLDPTFVIGGKLNAAGANAHLGEGDYIVVEADESDASFLNLFPTLCVITNIDVDHMETYGHSVPRLLEAFVDFTRRLPFYGSVVMCTDDENVRAIRPLMTVPVVSYGFNDQAQYQAINVRSEGVQMHFDVIRRPVGASPGKPPLHVVLNMPGQHNVLNALAAIAVAGELQIQDKAVLRALAEFSGVGRRFTQIGVFELPGHGKIRIIDDYGHHPVELKATLDAARAAYPDQRIVLAFQPHRYSRTRDYFDQFCEILSSADLVFLTDVYPAGEAKIKGADTESLVEALEYEYDRADDQLIYVPDVADLKDAICEQAQDGDVVLIMGAGSIGKVPQEFVEHGCRPKSRIVAANFYPAPDLPEDGVPF